MRSLRKAERGGPVCPPCRQLLEDLGNMEEPEEPPWQDRDGLEVKTNVDSRTGQTYPTTYLSPTRSQPGRWIGPSAEDIAYLAELEKGTPRGRAHANPEAGPNLSQGLVSPLVVKERGRRESHLPPASA